MKKIASFLIASALLASCNVNPTPDSVDREQQKTMQTEAQRQAGMPAIHNYQEKKLLKMIYELRDNEKIVNYAYLFNDMQGKLVFLGKCIGYGIPYATQYSNPERPAESWETHEQGNITLPQAEPNGLFMPSAAEGTWLMLLDKDGQPHPTYIEPRVIVSAFALNLN
jgi:hypothetical protein